MLEMKKSYTLYLDEELIKRLEEEKKNSGVSPSWRINKLVKERYEEMDKNKSKVKGGTNQKWEK